MTWNPDMWGWLTDGSGTFGGDNPFGPQSILPAVVVPEHCEINDPVPLKFTYKGKVIHDYGSQDWEGSEHEETYTRNAQTKMKLATGGRAVPGAQSLIKISGSAWEVLDKRVAPPDFNWDRMRTIPPEQLRVGTLGNLDTNGELWVVLPDGDPDVTVTAGPDYFIYGVGADKYKLVHHTKKQALADKNPGRLQVGVGEELEFYFADISEDGPPIDSLTEQAHWFATVGNVAVRLSTPVVATNSAPDTTQPFEVWASVHGVELPHIPYEVKEPEGEHHAIITLTDFTGIQGLWPETPLGFRSGDAGAEMSLHVFIGPTDVSFYKVEIRELPEDASFVKDYFSNTYFDVNYLHHNPGEYRDWISLGEDNSWTDWCWNPHPLPPFGTPPTWAPGGSFTWVIPVKWRMKQSGVNGANMTGWNQVFTIDSSGTLKITKFPDNKWVERTIGNVIHNN